MAEETMNLTPEERAWLDGEKGIAIQRAIEIVVTLGRFSMARYFPGQRITRIHGQAKRVTDVFYLPLFHPAAALRNTAWHDAMVKDIRRVPELLAQLTPSPSSAENAGEGADNEDHFEQLRLF